MLQLSTDTCYHFELLRMLATARAYGADVAEILNVCDQVKAGDFESWYEQFNALAKWVESTVSAERDYDKATLRDAYFRISRYHFASSFFLTGNVADPRLTSSWKQWTRYFDRAAATFDIPPERHIICADGFKVPVILLRASVGDTPRPCLILGNGLDGSMEEMLHFHGLAALERGYHVLLYEGPGQTTVRREQGLGFINDREKVITPVLDWLKLLSFIDPDRVGLLGLSLGGYLAVRAAAFEHRLAAVILVDGIFDVSTSIRSIFGKRAIQSENNDVDQFHRDLDLRCSSDTTAAWLANQIRWAFKTKTTHEALQKTKQMTLSGILDKVKCPVFVADAEHDSLVDSGQPPLVAKGLGQRATYKKFTKEESAEAHCHLGATAYTNQVLLEWFKDQVSLPN